MFVLDFCCLWGSANNIYFVFLFQFWAFLLVVFMQPFGLVSQTFLTRFKARQAAVDRRLLLRKKNGCVA